MKIAVQDKVNKKYYVVDVTPTVARRHDNGALISCGWSLGEDLSQRAFSRMSKKEITKDEWNHSGCQSSCIRRGAPKCSW